MRDVEKTIGEGEMNLGGDYDPFFLAFPAFKRGGFMDLEAVFVTIRGGILSYCTNSFFFSNVLKSYSPLLRHYSLGSLLLVVVIKT